MAAPDTTVRQQAAGGHAEAAVLQSWTEPVPPVDPVVLFQDARRTLGVAAYWERPADGTIMVGIGAAHQIALEGSAGSAWVFGEARREWQRLVAGATLADGAAPPVLLGGFAFDPAQAPAARWSGFPAGLLTLPALLYRQSGAAAALTYSVVLPPGAPAERGFRTLRDTWLATRGRLRLAADRPPTGPATPTRTEPLEPPVPPTAWYGLVDAAAQEVRSGRLEKVVLARSETLPASYIVDPATALTRLRQAHQTGTIFALACAGRCFLGATPERLVQLRSGQVVTAGLAGSRRRGATAREDAVLEQELLRSSKDRWEHAIVVRELEDALRAAGVALPATPRTAVLKVASVQHLYTPLSGEAPPGCNVLDLLARLHPSPAVGGYPRAEALAWIRTHEHLDRGWYAGPVGWVDCAGDGDFAVAIRSALVDAQGATLFAGCGIMGDSDPAAEYAESCLKLRPMQAALRGPGE